MPMKLLPDVHELDAHHRARFVKADGKVIGLVLFHDRLQTVGEEDPHEEWLPCDPGLVQWEPYGVIRPLFTVTSLPNAEISLSPAMGCQTCEDRGRIENGKWIADGKFDPDDEDDMLITRTPDAWLGEEPDEEPVAISEEKAEDAFAPVSAFRPDDKLDFQAIEDEFGPLLDSGHRRVLPTGAQRDRARGKGRYDLLMVRALRRVALILEKGAEKYEERNWEKGMNLSIFADSAFRHFCQWLAGMEDEDHLGQAAWNLLAAMETQEMIKAGILPVELDDLPNYGGSE